MLKIRLQRIGRRNNPSYRIVAVDSRSAAKKGNPVALLGTCDTIRKKTTIDKDRVLYWMSQGAQVSDTVHNILITNNVLEGRKRNALPKKHPIASATEEQQPTAPSDETAAQEDAPAPEEQKDVTPAAEERKDESADQAGAPEPKQQQEDAAPADVAAPTPEKNPSEEG